MNYRNCLTLVCFYILAALPLLSAAETKDDAVAEAKEDVLKERAKAEAEAVSSVKATANEAAMPDRSTPADSLTDKGETVTDHEDCGAEFAEMKLAEANEREKGESRGDLAVYSGFTLKFQGEENPFSLMTTTIMPGKELKFTVSGGDKKEEFSAVSDDGAVTRKAAGSWSWLSPETPGHYCIKVSCANSADVACLQVFVLKPYNGEEVLNGFPIGAYPANTMEEPENSIKRRPAGFIEVTRENLDTWVSPHFQLKQFQSKGFDGYPRYLLIRTRLLLKLEILVEEFTKAGLEGDSVYVMSAFRTPAYNVKIGNKTTLSRHTFGDAADIYIDANRDSMIDDLNGDGKMDTADASVLYDLVKNVKKDGWRKPLGGGLSLYPANASRSAFIHVDARGTDVFWENL